MMETDLEFQNNLSHIFLVETFSKVKDLFISACRRHCSVQFQTFSLCLEKNLVCFKQLYFLLKNFLKI